MAVIHQLDGKSLKRWLDTGHKVVQANQPDVANALSNSTANDRKETVIQPTGKLWRASQVNGKPLLDSAEHIEATRVLLTKNTVIFYFLIKLSPYMDIQTGALSRTFPDSPSG